MQPSLPIIFTQLIVELLPLSSSGHILLMQHCMHKFGLPVTPMPSWFDHWLHGPTLVVLAWFFYPTWWRTTKRIIACDHQLMLCTIGMLSITTGLSAIGYIILRHYWNNSTWPIIGLTLTMITLLSLKFCKEKACTCAWLKTSIILGILQATALLIPGLSRFGITYVGARWLGYSHRRSLQLSFLIFAPLIAAAFLGNGCRFLMINPDARTLFTLPVIITVITGTILSAGCLVVIDYLGKRNKLWLLGVYLILPIVLLWWL